RSPAQPSSPEAEALLKRLTTLAESQNDVEQAELGRELAKSATLEMLDKSAERSQRIPEDLLLARIMERLATNSSPAAATTLRAVSQADALNADWRLQQLVIRAFGKQRPLLPDSVAYLDAQSQPKSLNLQIVIMTLVENESPPALD